MREDSLASRARIPAPTPLRNNFEDSAYVILSPQISLSVLSRQCLSLTDRLRVNIQRYEPPICRQMSPLPQAVPYRRRTGLPSVSHPLQNIDVTPHEIF